ncbi:MAG: LuxR C-terminal-related transcriptional regulator [Xanthomonadaceae bacterium]|nr:LuxR C-terminal-related transcriptional regulator [Xanthomonadaceae bacterium]MDP2185192.1 LuxR C-terminal-related transcriptional regulator [Xanthomonadales bacterium]MDZ4116977.1 LuxR C-terminal-related transcriptional regulator [Xanthomonadaceae bacterium]
MPGSVAQVLIAVDGDLLRFALAEMVRGMPEYSLRGVAVDAATAIIAMRSHKLDVLFLDVVLAEKVKAAFGGHGTHPRVLLFSPRRHIGLDATCAMDCACGFLRERAPLKHMQVVTRIVASCDVAAAGAAKRCETCPLRPTLEPAQLPVSGREREVFARIGAGESNQVIAQALGISVKTVECHRENCKHKLGLRSAFQLVAAAVAWRAGDYVPDRDSVLLRR